MRDLIRHRGPDDKGFASIDAESGAINQNGEDQNASAVLGFTRLSIRDLSHRGHQPMVSDDSTVVILFNGEVYNTDELKEKYLPHQEMHSGSDTELLLRLYQEIGIEKLAIEIDGMFAIVIYDSRKRSLVIARDRFGIKPLYYSHTSQGLAISSEIKPLLKSGLVKAEPELDALGELALFRYVADPETPFKNIASIPPGCIARVNADSTMRIERYWRPDYSPSQPSQTHSDSDATELLKETIDSSVRSQFVSDVKVGLELSGGVDSSLLAWAAEGSGLEGYSAIPTLKEISEEQHIDRVCNTTSTISNKVTLDPDTIAQVIGEVAYYHETPINHEGSIGVYLVCRQARADGTTVLLSGEGADELFGGYHRHRILGRNMAKARTVSKYLGPFSGLLPRKVKTAKEMWKNRERSLALVTAFGIPELATSIFPSIDIENTLDRRSSHMSGFNADDFDGGHLVYDQRTYLVDLLARQDKMSMANSVETRVPFLGNGVADLAASLPMSQKLGPNGEGKILLKNLVATKFGKEHAFRSKSGFGVPFSFISQSETVLKLAQQCAVGLSRDGLANDNSQVFEQAAQKDGYAIRSAWILLSVGLWYDIYFRGGEIASQHTDLPGRI
jgi:asparagine synthase (glutamine-hydrolysing)